MLVLGRAVRQLAAAPAAMRVVRASPSRLFVSPLASLGTFSSPLASSTPNGRPAMPNPPPSVKAIRKAKPRRIVEDLDVRRREQMPDVKRASAYSTAEQYDIQRLRDDLNPAIYTNKTLFQDLVRAPRPPSACTDARA